MRRHLLDKSSIRSILDPSGGDNGLHVDSRGQQRKLVLAELNRKWADDGSDAGQSQIRLYQLPGIGKLDTDDILGTEPGGQKCSRQALDRRLQLAPGPAPGYGISNLRQIGGVADRDVFPPARYRAAKVIGPRFIAPRSLGAVLGDARIGMEPQRPTSSTGGPAEPWLRLTLRRSVYGDIADAVFQPSGCGFAPPWDPK